jgi:hypothetical protein
MANVEDLETGDTYIWSDSITSKYCDDDNVNIMSIRHYARNMESLMETIDKIGRYGIDNTDEETFKLTANTPIPPLFLLDVVKSLIVAHVKQTVSCLVEDLEWDKRILGEEADDDEDEETSND